MNQSEKPKALLLISSLCPHCHALETLLHERMEKGILGEFKITNIEQSPEVAKQYSVRSVPWLCLGSFIFNEALTPAELDRWIALVQTSSGQSHYIEYLLERGQLIKAIEWIENNNASLQVVIPLLANPDTKMNVRVGVGAILEHFEDTQAIRDIVPELIFLLKDSNPSVRTDACHYLSLTHSMDVMESLKAMLDDADQQVREVAQESIEDLVQ